MTKTSPEQPMESLPEDLRERALQIAENLSPKERKQFLADLGKKVKELHSSEKQGEKLVNAMEKLTNSEQVAERKIERSSDEAADKRHMEDIEQQIDLAA
jgi:hypothetical protein